MKKKNKLRCKGVTKAGNKCKLPAIRRGFCQHHSKETGPRAEKVATYLGIILSSILLIEKLLEYMPFGQSRGRFDPPGRKLRVSMANYFEVGDFPSLIESLSSAIPNCHPDLIPEDLTQELEESLLKLRDIEHDLSRLTPDEKDQILNFSRERFLSDAFRPPYFELPLSDHLKAKLSK